MQAREACTRAQAGYRRELGESKKGRERDKKAFSQACKRACEACKRAYGACKRVCEAYRKVFLLRAEISFYN